MFNGTQSVPLEIKDFSGGMTDNVFNGDLSRFQRGDNLDIVDDGTLKTRSGSEVVDEDYPRLPTNKPFRAIMNYRGELLFQSERGLHYKDGTGFHEILGPGPDFDNPAYSDAAASSYATGAYWNHNLITVNNYPSRPVRVFKDAGAFKVHNLGLPAYTGNPVIGGGGSSGGTKAHAYAAHYEVEYTANGITFLERGAVKFFGEATVYKAISAANPVTITPSAGFISNSVDCYDKANIKLVIYRNSDAGNVWYRVGEMLNTDAIFTDEVEDADLVLNSILYTDGGVLDHEQPPEARYVHQTNDILYLGAIREGGIVRENKLRMSNRFMLWSCPGSFEEEFEDNITGISSVGVYPIVFCKNSVYRLDGFYDQKGLGTVRKKRISDTIGCVSARSIIQTENGVYFAGNNGFYFTNGAEVTRVSDEINQTYLGIVAAGQLENIYGVLDGINQKLYWAVTETLGHTENNTIFVGHLKKTKGNHVPFTRWTGGYDVPGFTPVSLAVENDALYRGNKDGYFFRHTKELTCDFEVQVGVDPNTWRKSPIMHNLASICLNFGTNTVKKWIPYLTLSANNLTDLHMDIYSSNDNIGAVYEKKLKPVSDESRFGWEDPDLSWGDPVTLNVYPVINAKRSFPKGGIRCFYRQIRFTLGNAKIAESGDENKAMITAGNVVPANHPTFAWPQEYFNLEISFEHDGYKERFKILTNDGETLTVENPLNTLPAGEVAWRLYAHPTDEVLNLISYTLFHQHTSQNQNVYRGES